MSQKRITNPPNASIIDWTSKTVINEMLSQFYVQRRSVVFIVDQSFSGSWCEQKANELVREQFTQLDPQDYCGFISLETRDQEDLTVHQGTRRFNLEMKAKNKKLKDCFINPKCKKQHDEATAKYFLPYDGNDIPKHKRLEAMLVEAMNW